MDALSAAPPTSLRWENPATRSYYETRVAQNLFGTWEVARVWGGIGSSRGAIRFDPVGDPAEAAELVAAIDQRRAQRGYARVERR